MATTATPSSLTTPSTRIAWTTTAARPLTSTLRYGLLVPLLLLVFGVTNTPAQVVEDPCAPYTGGGAQRLCTAAVAAGCFPSSQSSTCTTLAQTWNEGCLDCEGAAPWGAPCPCNINGLNAEALYTLLESMNGTIGAVGCTYTKQNALLGIAAIDWLGEPTPYVPWMILHAEAASNGAKTCHYSLDNNPNGFWPPPPPLPAPNLSGLTAGQLGACRKDISTLMDQLNASPFFCGFQFPWGS